jgi:hypothetical protein
VCIYALSDESLSSKENTSDKKGKEFRLTHFQRRQLWEDDLLSIFTWVFPSGSGQDVQFFMELVKMLALRDGFEVAFPTLYGGDHMAKDDVPWGWNGGMCIISDVTWAVDFTPEGYDDEELQRVKDCGRWKKMKQVIWGFDKNRDHKPCWPCWSCRKVDNLARECVDMADAGELYGFLPLHFEPF